MKSYKHFIILAVILVPLLFFIFNAKADIVPPEFTVTANPTSVNVNATSTISVSMTNTSADGCLNQGAADCYCWVKDSSPLISWHTGYSLPLVHTLSSYVLTNTSPITETIDCKWTPTQTSIGEHSVDISINPPVPTIAISPTGAPGSSAGNPLPLPNSGTTVAFSSTNADYCVLNNQTLGTTYSFSTGALNSNTNYLVECYGPGGSSSAQVTVYVGSALSDLTASPVSAVSAVVNIPVTFSSVVTNIGNASTGSSFNNFFQVASLPGGSGALTDLSSVSSPVLAINASSTLNKSYTFTSVGTYSVRVCADKSNRNDPGTINETNENNNCSSWVDVIVNPQTTVNGTCGAHHFLCDTGMSINNQTTPTMWTWRCEGI